MTSSIIIMLTHNDQTHINALNIFESVKDLDIQYWGFKDVGLPFHKMKELIGNMKAAGKTTFFEVVSYSAGECMSGVKVAVELGFDYLMGTLFYDDVFEYVKSKGIKYLPFAGDIQGHPSILKGTIQEVIENAAYMTAKGVLGFDLIAYRFTGDCELLANRFVNEVSVPVVIAGSIDSAERIKIVCEINPFAFTMGSALFNSRFVTDGTFRENLCEVMRIMNELQKS